MVKDAAELVNKVERLLTKKKHDCYSVNEVNRRRHKHVTLPIGIVNYSGHSLITDDDVRKYDPPVTKCCGESKGLYCWIWV